MDELEFYNGQWSGQEIDARITVVDTGTITELPITITNSKILSKHIVIGAYDVSGGGQFGNWTVVTTDGSLTITGTINQQLSMKLILGIPL